MSLAGAYRLIQRSMVESELRCRLSEAVDSSAREQVLSEEACECNQEEFDEAFRATLVKCQSRDAADALQQLRLWWLLLSRS